MRIDGKIAIFVLWITLIILCVLVGRNTNAVNTGNEQGDRQEYERVLLGCNTSGAITSTDPALRELCDKKLPILSQQQKGK